MSIDVIATSAMIQRTHRFTSYQFRSIGRGGLSESSMSRGLSIVSIPAATHRSIVPSSCASGAGGPGVLVGRMCLTLHQLVSDRPGPSRALANLLDYAIDTSDSWNARADHVTQWWRDQHGE
jgi:hypothetical protein